MIIIALILFVYGLSVILSRKYQLFGKQPVREADAFYIGLVFLLPFAAHLIELALSIRDTPTPPLVTAFQYISLLVCVAIIGYTAFFAPDASVLAAPVSLSETVTSAAAAEFLNLPEEDVIRLIETGGLQARLVDGRYRIHREILLSIRQAHSESQESAGEKNK